MSNGRLMFRRLRRRTKASTIAQSTPHHVRNLTLNHCIHPCVCAHSIIVYTPRLLPFSRPLMAKGANIIVAPSSRLDLLASRLLRVLSKYVFWV